jgi:hypothetical protein
MLAYCTSVCSKYYTVCTNVCWQVVLTYILVHRALYIIDTEMICASYLVQLVTICLCSLQDFYHYYHVHNDTATID